MTVAMRSERFPVRPSELVAPEPMTVTAAHADSEASTDASRAYGSGGMDEGWVSCQVGWGGPSATHKKCEVENASSRACSKPTSLVLVIPSAKNAGCVNFAETPTTVRFASLSVTM